MSRFWFSFSIFMTELAFFVHAVLFWASYLELFCFLLLHTFINDCFLRLEVGFNCKFHGSPRALIGGGALNRGNIWEDLPQLQFNMQTCKNIFFFNEYSDHPPLISTICLLSFLPLGNFSTGFKIAMASVKQCFELQVITGTKTR